MRRVITGAILAAGVLVPMPALAQSGAVVAPPGQTAPPSQQAGQGTSGTEPQPGDMVGYIDDATIHTQVRVRFDAGFHDDFPDLAEFFYAKCGCYQGLPTANAAFDPNAPGPQPGVPSYVNFQQVYLDVQLAAARRLAVFGDLPVRWLQPFGPSVVGGPLFSDQSGLADVSAGVKAALVSSDRTTVTLQLLGQFPTGDASKGLGTNHASVQTSLLVRRDAGNGFALDGEFGDWHPIGGSAGIPTADASKRFAGDVVFYGIGPSYELVRTRRLSVAPVVEVVGWHVVSGFATGPGDVSGTNIVNLKVGVRTTFDRGTSLYIGYGHALTAAAWYDDILRVELRRVFGR